MPVGQLNDRYWFLKNLRRHRERLGAMKAETDSSAPKLPVDPRNDKRKVGAALQRVQKINNDNARLLVRLSKVFANGGNLTPADLGKDPKLEHQRKALRNNASKVIKKRAELNRITFDNKFLLNRILDVPSVINYKDVHYLETNKRHKQLREETTYYRQKHSPFPMAEKHSRASRASSRASSASPSGRSSMPSTPLYASRVVDEEHAHVERSTPQGEQRPRTGDASSADYLSLVKEEHLAMLLSMRKPPELVRRVFSALMILVSPFEPTHVDISWVAVQEWVKEIGTVKSFLENLATFEVGMVPQANAERTAAFMRQSGLHRERLVPLSDALANLADWLRTLCGEAGAYGDGQDEASVTGIGEDAQSRQDAHEEATQDGGSEDSPSQAEQMLASLEPASPEPRMSPGA